MLGLRVVQVIVLEQAVAGIGLYNRKWPGPGETALRQATSQTLSCIFPFTCLYTPVVLGTTRDPTDFRCQNSLIEQNKSKDAEYGV